MHQVQLAIELIELGARLQVLETETELSRTRLIKLYKEVRGMSPPKGMLPFSTDWFITWLPNVHSSLFYNIYLSLKEAAGCNRIDAFVKAYRLYDEQMLNQCTRCTGQFVTHAHSPAQHYVCGICQPPSRAGKTRKAQRENSEKM